MDRAVGDSKPKLEDYPPFSGKRHIEQYLSNRDEQARRRLAKAREASKSCKLKPDAGNEICRCLCEQCCQETEDLLTPRHTSSSCPKVHSQFYGHAEGSPHLTTYPRLQELLNTIATEKRIHDEEVGRV